jgi:site-specific recombinase XerD
MQHGQKQTQAHPQDSSQASDLEHSKSAVLNSLRSTSSQRSYDHAIREFIEWYCSEPRLAFNRIVVTRYRIFLEQAHYASSTINLRLAAVRRLAYEAADAGLLSPDLAAGIRRVKGVKKHGVRCGNWLTAEQGKKLLQVFDRECLRGKRDYAMIAVLLGCGLRRAELQLSLCMTCSNGKSIGSSQTWLEKAVTSELFLFQTGSVSPFTFGCPTRD